MAKLGLFKKCKFDSTCRNQLRYLTNMNKIKEKNHMVISKAEKHLVKFHMDL